MSAEKNIISVCDGMSCGQMALNLVGVNYNRYFASEIDEYPIKVTQSIYPKTIQIGDIKNVNGSNFKDVYLLMGGTPCQGFSISGNKLNFDDERSRLFFEFVRLKKECNPKFFLFENVGSMDAKIRNKISEELGVNHTHINSDKFSGQHRNRYYWTNIPIDSITDKQINFKDILESDVDRKYYYSEKVLSRLDLSNIVRAGKAGYKCKGIEVNKSAPIVARHYKGMQSQHYPVIREQDGFRKLTPRECGRLQTVPENVLNIILSCGVSDSQIYKMLGNGWTVDVVAHIFKSLLNENCVPVPNIYEKVITNDLFNQQT